MTQRTTYRKQTRDSNSDDSTTPDLADVITHAVSYMKDDEQLADRIRPLIKDSADPSELSSQIAEGWAREWTISGFPASTGFQHDSMLSIDVPQRRKFLLLREGLHETSVDALFTGVNNLLKRGGVEDSWWLTDLQPRDFEQALERVETAQTNGSREDGEERLGPLPAAIDEYYQSRVKVRMIAKGKEPKNVSLPFTLFRAYLYASWVRGRTLRFAEQKLVSFLYRSPDYVTTIESEFPEMD